jgi:hypothetical protein
MWNLIKENKIYVAVGAVLVMVLVIIVAFILTGQKQGILNSNNPGTRTDQTNALSKKLNLPAELAVQLQGAMALDMVISVGAFCEVTTCAAKQRAAVPRWSGRLGVAPSGVRMSKRPGRGRLSTCCAGRACRSCSLRVWSVSH